MDCRLDDVLRALSEGVVSPLTTAPPFLDGRGRPRADGKSVYGESLQYQIDSANFTVQWDGDASDAAEAGRISDALEAGWTSLVDDGGWTQPVSSDRYLLWVILDPDISGSGFTTTYESAEYPEGYPVIWVNPIYAQYYPEFVDSVAVHEFGHALQFTVRDWGGGWGESWYWEATSEWLSEHVLPEADTYAWSSEWYAAAPEEPYDSTTNYHQYGMFLLNAYLDEYVVGIDGIRDVWIASESGDPWPTLIEDVAGADFGELVADMSGAVASNALADGWLYWEVEHERDPDEVVETTLDLPGLFGTHYVGMETSGELVVEGDVAVRYVTRDAWGTTPPGETRVVTFTALEEDGAYTWSPGEDAPEDTADAVDPPDEEASAACGCRGQDSTIDYFAAGTTLAILGAVLRRRPADTVPA